MKYNLSLLLVSLIVMLSAVGCRNNTESDTALHTDTLIHHARLLKVERGEGFTRVTIADPWNEGRVLHRYVLVPREAALPEGLPEGTVVRTPINRALVYSSVHSSVMRELGCFDAIKGVVDAQYFTEPEVAQALAAGQLTDCGSSMSPTLERVIQMQPDAILLSPYQDAAYGQITQLDVPLIECADYMEYTPLGRAEWIKFYGALLGREAQADSIFTQVTKAYEEIRQRAEKVSKKPMVLTETVISGIWNVPGGQSYMARILQDAGAVYPWADDKSTGSLNLDFNQVLARARQADVWLIKSFFIHSLEDLRGAYRLNDQFRAFQQRQVYVCDTNTSHLFEQFPFHPERLLADYFAIFHPDLAGDYRPVFFHRLDK